MTVLALVACFLTGERTELSDYVARLRAWEARFDRTSIAYSLASNTDSTTKNKAPTKLLLENWPGAIQTWKMDANGHRTLVASSVSGQALWRHTESTSADSPTYSLYAGSALAGDILWVRGKCRDVLYRLGVLLAADLPMSDALQRSRTWRVEASRGPRLVFEPDPSSGLKDAKVSITFSGGNPVQLSLTVSGEERIRHTIQVKRSDSGLAGCSVESMRFARGSPPDNELVAIERVEPLVQIPMAWKPRQGEPVLMEAFSVVLPFEEEVLPLDEKRAKAVLSRLDQPKAIPRPTLSPANEKAFLRCGPDALYYLGALSGHPLNAKTLLSEFGDLYRGTSLGDLYEVAASYGLATRMRRWNPDELSRVPLPAILHVTPSHFLVVVSRNKGAYTVLSPPYDVRVDSESQLASAWSGRSMELVGR